MFKIKEINCYHCKENTPEYKFIEIKENKRIFHNYCENCISELNLPLDRIILSDIEMDLFNSEFISNYLKLDDGGTFLPLSMEIQEIIMDIVNRCEDSQQLSPEPSQLLLKLLEKSNILKEYFKNMNLDSQIWKGILSQNKSNDSTKTKKINDFEVVFSKEMKNIFFDACRFAEKTGYGFIATEHLFAGILENSPELIAKISDTGMLTAKNVFKYLQQQGMIVNKAYRIPTPTLDLYGIDLTDMAREGMLDPVIGRDTEINRVIRILGRRTKHNVVLIGEAGVGKTAIVEAIAQKIFQNGVPNVLREKRIISLDMNAIVSGTRYRGDFEKRMEQILDDIRKTKNNIILFIDEVHIITKAGGSSEGALTAACILKPVLARGDVQCIGATTINEYDDNIRKDAALERRFQPVRVEEPSVKETIQILNGIKYKYENYHNVQYSEEAIKMAVKLSDKFIKDRNFPDKAIDLIDEAAVKVIMENYMLEKDNLSNSHEIFNVNKETIIEILVEWTGIDAKKLKED